MKKLLVISLIISILCSTITSCQLLTDINGQSEDDNQFHLVYNRSFDEGWDIKNGMKLVDQGSTGSTTFNIEYEETEDFSYNYFMRLELNSTDNEGAQCISQDGRFSVQCLKWTLSQMTYATSQT